MTTSTNRSTTASTLVVATDEGVRLPGRDDALLPGRHIDAITTDADELWAIVDRVELHRLLRSGTVERVATLDEGTATCVHVHRGTVWVGGDEGALWRLDDGALEPVESFRHAPTHDEWHTPWGGPPSVLSMASHGDDLYVGVHVGGILRTADGGTSWTDTIDLHVDVHEVIVDPRDGVVWAVTGEHALMESRDQGASWRAHSDGLHATYSLALALTDRGVLVGASSGHAGRDGAVYLFDGTAFERVRGLPDRLDGAVGPRQISGEGARGALVVPGGDAYTSDDGGRSWNTDPSLHGATAITLLDEVAA